MNEPEIQFAVAGGVRVAWEQFGAGPDVLMIPPLASNIELVWEQPEFRRMLEYLGRHVRVTAFDKRGIGSSDRFDGVPTLEERTLDILAVLDAARVDRAVLIGMSEGGLMAQLFAARHPERVSSMVLYGSAPGASAMLALHTDDDGSTTRLERFDARLNALVESWGREPQVMADWFVPSRAGDSAFVRWLGRLQRQTATAADLRRQLRSTRQLDAVDELARITAPTLVLHSVGDQVMPVAAAHYLAARIPGARLVEIDGNDHIAEVGDRWQGIADTWLGFVLGSAVVRSTQRQLATVVFTDIVGSTATTLAVGDRAWRDLLDRHDRLAVRLAAEHGGALVKTIGDGLLARFPTPRDALSFASRLRGELAEVGLIMRIGVHTGEVELLDNGDIRGAAVNLAARVEQAAPPGSIVVSSTVRDLLLGGELTFDDRGTHVLKGFDEPWRLYALRDLRSEGG